MSREKLTMHQKLLHRKIKQPPTLIYLFLAYIWKAMFIKKLGVQFIYNIDIKKYKGSYIVVSNHASRLDYIYTGIAFLPHRLNYVAGYNEFFRSHLAFIFRLLQIIPKKNFVPDFYTIKEFSRIIRSGGRVIIFPEGMSSISGSNQPCAVGSGKLLKTFKVPVLMTKISGGYLTNTKYCLDERYGKVEVVVDELFTPKQLEDMTAEEIQIKLDKAIANNDYEWNKIAKVKFDGKGEMAKNIHMLLYWCPRCKLEFNMISHGNIIKCSNCGNGAILNEYYNLIPLDESCEIPSTPHDWFAKERENTVKELLNENYELTERVKLGMLPKYKYLKEEKTSEIVGEGKLLLNKSGLYYNGTKDGEQFEFCLQPKQLPTFGMCTDVSRFYTFFNDEFYEFFPERESVAKWLLAVEENHRLAGGKWKNFNR